ncbi:MAG: hypothetical protein R2734_19655 [Nocardioides sp.]
MFTLLGEDAEVSEGTRHLILEMQRAAGLEPSRSRRPSRPPRTPPGSRAQGDAAVGARGQLANRSGPRLQPRRAAAAGSAGRVGADRAPAEDAFEHPVKGAPACMGCPRRVR